MADQEPTVAEIKDQIKSLIKSSQLKEAINYANVKYESIDKEELKLRQEVTLVHWWTKAYSEGSDLRNLTTKCLTKVNTMINSIMTSSAGAFKKEDGTTEMSGLELAQCLCELLYLKRVIDTQAMFAHAEKTIKMMEDTLTEKPGNKDDLLCTKYFIKALLRYDEYQLGVEAKDGYQQLLLAQRLDQDVLVRKHKHFKETIKIQLNKMLKFKQFMDVSMFDKLSSMAMRSHRTKPEVIPIMRALAIKHSDLGNHEKAIHYVGRAETLAQEKLQNPQHVEVLMNMSAKVEILLKKLRLGTEEDFAEPIAIAKAAYELALKIYGAKTFITNQTMLSYAMTLTKVKSKEAESQALFEKGEKQFDVIANEISNKENCNLMFNMLLHYNFMLNDFSSTVDPEKRMTLVQKLKEQVQISNHNVLFKESLIAIQEIFIQEDPSELLPQFQNLLDQVSQPSSGIPSPSYIQIMLKYFVANLCLRVQEMDRATTLAKQMLDHDIKNYFGHMQSDISIEPMLIILNQKFDVLTQSPLTQQSTNEEKMAYGKLFQEVQTLAKETEEQIIAIQGDRSEKLIEVFCLYSFFAFQQGKPDEVLFYQRKSTQLCLETYGEMTQQYLQRLQEQIQMEIQCGPKAFAEAIKDSKIAARIGKELLKEKEEQEVRLQIARTWYEASMYSGDANAQIESLEEMIDLVRVMGEDPDLSGPATSKETLAAYLLHYSVMLEKVGRMQESVEMHKESQNLIKQVTPVSQQAKIQGELTKRQARIEEMEKQLIENARQEEEAKRKEAQGSEDPSATAVDKPVDTSVTMSEGGESILNPNSSSGKFFIAGLLVSAAAGIGYLVLRRKAQN